jgi:hypothetical protein
VQEGWGAVIAFLLGGGGEGEDEAGHYGG